jgi:hypothetical protein
MNGMVEITLAGISKKYPVTCLIKSAGDNEQHLQGTRSFRFSDFDLKPLNKLLWPIKAQDNVTMVFHLRLTSIIAENDTNKEIGRVR